MEHFILLNVYSIGRGDEKYYRADVYSDKHILRKIYVNNADVVELRDKLFTDVTESIDFYYDKNGVPVYYLKH